MLYLFKVSKSWGKRPVPTWYRCFQAWRAVGQTELHPGACRSRSPNGEQQLASSFNDCCAVPALYLVEQNNNLTETANNAINTFNMDEARRLLCFHRATIQYLDKLANEAMPFPGHAFQIHERAGEHRLNWDTLLDVCGQCRPSCLSHAPINATLPRCFPRAHIPTPPFHHVMLRSIVRTWPRWHSILR